MRSEPPGHRAIRLAGVLADRQQGVVARWQLIACGVRPDIIQRLIARGFLIPVHRGVYLVGHRALARFTHEMAGALALGPQTVVSHRSAASMLGLLPYPAQADVWVTVAKGDRRSRRGIRVHRHQLATAEVGRLDGVPVTARARTLLDIAAIVDEEQLERAVANARIKGWAGESGLRRQLERSSGRRGAGRLRALLDREAEPAFTRSKAERLLLRLVRRSGLPEPESNARIHGLNVDLLWRRERVVVEFDSLKFHSHPVVFERDRAKGNDLQLHGYLIIRVTWRQLTHQPDLVRSRLETALALRRDEREVHRA